MVNANGALRFTSAVFPIASPLLTRVKEHERSTVRAALDQSTTRPAGARAQPAGGGRRHRGPPGRRPVAAAVTLDRGMGLLQATATNIIGMVGVGPFLTIPFMVTAMNDRTSSTRGRSARCSRLATASPTGAGRPPGSGGLRLPPRGLPTVRARRLMAFIFIFQLMLVAPLSVAGGAVGFADLGLPDDDDAAGAQPGGS